jgi:hypothetical protein
MELDNLKSAWQQNANQFAEVNKKETSYLESIIKGKTLDMIELLRKKFKRIIMFASIGMVNMAIVFPFLSDGFTYPGSVNGFVKMVFFYILVVAFYWTKLKSIQYLELSDHIKERLEQLLMMMKRNMKIELWFTGIFMVSFIVIGRFFYGKGLSRLSDTGFLISFPITLIFAGLIIRMIIKRYQNLIGELNTYINEYQ